MNTIIREPGVADRYDPDSAANRQPGVEAGGAWRFRPRDAAITIRTAAKYPSDGGFHPRRPTPLDSADV
jgi:hypothetical protein